MPRTLVAEDVPWALRIICSRGSLALDRKLQLRLSVASTVAVDSASGGAAIADHDDDAAAGAKAENSGDKS